jgi:hypothetical protein
MPLQTPSPKRNPESKTDIEALLRLKNLPFTYIFMIEFLLSLIKS